MDFAVHLDGWCADAAFSVVVGDRPDPRDLALIDATERALAAGIAAMAARGEDGRRRARHRHRRPRAGFGMLADHGGHGVGRSMHEEPHVPNEGKPRRGLKLQPGLVIAIEPMLIAGGTDGYRHDRDGWTIRTADGSRAAHAEHTIAVVPDGRPGAHGATRLIAPRPHARRKTCGSRTTG